MGQGHSNKRYNIDPPISPKIDKKNNDKGIDSRKRTFEGIRDDEESKNIRNDFNIFDLSFSHHHKNSLSYENISLKDLILYPSCYYNYVGRNDGCNLYISDIESVEMKDETQFMNYILTYKGSLYYFLRPQLNMVFASNDEKIKHLYRLDLCRRVLYLLYFINENHKLFIGKSLIVFNGEEVDLINIITKKFSDFNHPNAQFEDVIEGRMSEYTYLIQYIKFDHYLSDEFKNCLQAIIEHIFYLIDQDNFVDEQRETEISTYANEELNQYRYISNHERLMKMIKKTTKDWIDKEHILSHNSIQHRNEIESIYDELNKVQDKDSLNICVKKYLTTILSHDEKYGFSPVKRLCFFLFNHFIYKYNDIEDIGSMDSVWSKWFKPDGVNKFEFKTMIEEAFNNVYQLHIIFEQTYPDNSFIYPMTLEKGENVFEYYFVGYLRTVSFLSYNAYDFKIKKEEHWRYLISYDKISYDSYYMGKELFQMNKEKKKDYLTASIMELSKGKLYPDQLISIQTKIISEINILSNE